MKKDLKISSLYRLSKKYKKRWPSIFKASKESALKIEKIKKIIEKGGLSMAPDTDLVICGSLARNECTLSSDTDWLLLVNGPVNNTHLDIAKKN